ncbi:MAG TPA: MraY family glycosyltransferase [Acidimicrobiia bacterium]|nr:MraY family glycosyltransferase [Acidimicrobiia bacterium]
MAGLTLAAAAVSLSWAVTAVWLGPRIGYVEAPGEDPLKTHARPAVPLGGIGVFLGVHIAMALGGRFDPALLAATSVVVVLGLVDDRRPLPPYLRIAGWSLAAGIVALDATGVVTGMVLAAVAIVAIASVNLLDGLDGLAGGSALVAAAGLAFLAGARDVDHALPLLVAGALAGFLVLNWHPARVFLGDSGAYLVGVLLAWSMAKASPGSAADLVVAAGVLGVFIVDLVVTILRRLSGRRPLFAGDRSHVYDQLRQRGRRVADIALWAAALQAAFVAVVLFADRFLPGITGALTVAGALGIAVAALVIAGFARG